MVTFWKCFRLPSTAATNSTWKTVSRYTASKPQDSCCERTTTCWCYHRTTTTPSTSTGRCKAAGGPATTGGAGERGSGERGRRERGREENKRLLMPQDQSASSTFREDAEMVLLEKVVLTAYVSCMKPDDTMISDPIGQSFIQEILV